MQNLKIKRNESTLHTRADDYNLIIDLCRDTVLQSLFENYSAAIPPHYNEGTVILVYICTENKAPFIVMQWYTNNIPVY
jgi:hypothetical protein